MTNERGICEYLHALFNGIYAGCNESAAYFYDADTARADTVYVFEIAKCRDLDVGCFGCVKNGGSRRHLHINTVHFKMNHRVFHILRTSYFLITAPNLQFDSQRPHFMHLF